MEIEKNAILAELISIIIFYYKRTITNKIYKRKIILEDLKLAEELIDRFSSNDQIELDQLINKVFANHIFIENEYKKINNYVVIESDENPVYKEINFAMKLMIQDMQEMLKKPFSSYFNRVSIFNLLDNFHNLPKPYLESSKETLLNAGFTSTNIENAIAYSISDLNEEQKERYFPEQIKRD